MREFLNSLAEIRRQEGKRASFSVIKYRRPLTQIELGEAYQVRKKCS